MVKVRFKVKFRVQKNSGLGLWRHSVSGIWDIYQRIFFIYDNDVTLKNIKVLISDIIQSRLYGRRIIVSIPAAELRVRNRDNNWLKFSKGQIIFIIQNLAKIQQIFL